MKKKRRKGASDARQAEEAAEALPVTRNPAKHVRSPLQLNSDCVVCGVRQVDSGRIFHGHCVCEDCVEYIVHEVHL